MARNTRSASSTCALPGTSTSFLRPGAAGSSSKLAGCGGAREGAQHVGSSAAQLQTLPYRVRPCAGRSCNRWGAASIPPSPPPPPLVACAHRTSTISTPRTRPSGPPMKRLVMTP